MSYDRLLCWPPIYLAGGLLLVWIGLITIRRRWFHPLSKIPGPFLWSVSGLPIFYHQVIREGQVMHELPKLHSLYGPVVRIGPNEIHVTGEENFDKIFRVGSKFLKDKDFFGPMEGPIKTPVILTAVSPAVHRARRAPLSPFFSRRSVLDLESVVWAKVRKLTDLMESQLLREPSRPFDMYRAIRAFSLDVITQYAFARCWNHLDDDDFGHWYQESMRNLQTWTESLDMIQLAVKEVRHGLDMDIKPPQKTIFHELMEAETSRVNGEPRQGLTDVEVFADAVNIVGAAAETTGATAERGIFEVINNRQVYEALTKELRGAFESPADMNFAALEKLPYLTAVVKEALRLNPGIPGRSPRVVPAGGATFNGFTVPEGTAVSIIATMLQQDEEIFPNPAMFDPRHWMGDSALVRERERSLVAFGRGTRNCLGQNLALCELYCSIAGVFYRFDDLKLADGIKREDMEVVELLLGYHRRNAKKFRITKDTT
ncbi:hypothetical protein PWT90_10764 [Aphanocladium album]|nr:hypothetical protein PWT90_10764 [Aphanocladium album]